MFIRAYLRASTQTQDANRAREQLQAFASDRDLKVAKFYVENESGASLKRPKLFELIADAGHGDVLLVEQVDRLSRLSEADWTDLKSQLNEKAIKVVALDLPTSWMMLRGQVSKVEGDDFTASMFNALNAMMLDMLAAIARKDYISRRQRAEQGIAKAKTSGKYKGRPEDVKRNELIQKHLKTGLSSWTEIMNLVGCSRATIAKQAQLLKDAPVN
jgi:DNA invertase Pin-like site-specific DNA recombinase